MLLGIHFLPLPPQESSGEGENFSDDPDEEGEIDSTGKFHAK